MDEINNYQIIKINKIMNKFNKQKVNLVWITPNVEEVITYCARVSSSEQNLDNKERLLKYLINNKHWSPFEMGSMCVEIITSRAIGRQILRHRSFSFQEFSQRYAKVQEFTKVEPRLQSEKNRQGSVEGISNKLKNKFNVEMEVLLDTIEKTYNGWIEDGIAKESARFILPENTITKMYMCGTIRSWIHYIQLRCKNNVQKEHREISEMIREILISKFNSLKEILYDEN